MASEHSKVEIRKIYDSIDFAINENAKRKKGSKDYMQGMSMSLDLTTINEYTKTSRQYYLVARLYFKNRPEFCINGLDYDLTAHEYTLITMSTGVLQKAGELLDMNCIEDVRLNVDVKKDKDGNVNASIGIGIHNDVPKHKREALKTIFDTFQKSIGSTQVVKDPSDTSKIDEGDFQDLDVDDITAKA